jgi:hypothetical protein
LFVGKGSIEFEIFYLFIEKMAGDIEVIKGMGLVWERPLLCYVYYAVCNDLYAFDESLNAG